MSGSQPKTYRSRRPERLASNSDLFGGQKPQHRHPKKFSDPTRFHLKKKPTLMASPLVSRAQQIDTTDRTYKNIRCCPDRRTNFGDVMCARKFLNYFMCVSELAMDFNDDVGSK